MNLHAFIRYGLRIIVAMMAGQLLAQVNPMMMRNNRPEPQQTGNSLLLQSGGFVLLQSGGKITL